MSSWLATQGIRPDLVVSSPALRALTTARLLAPGMSYPLERIRTDPHLYAADCATLLDRIAATDDAVGRLVLVGHNPGLTELVNRLGDRFVDNLPTCGICTLELPLTQWCAIHRVQGRILSLCTPKTAKPLRHNPHGDGHAETSS